jgi:putative hemolysin
VATIRLMCGQNLSPQGFYSQTEFDLSQWKIDFSKCVEMGRTCIHADHRKRHTLLLLFVGLKNYMLSKEARYLFGCASLAPMSHDDALATFEKLKTLNLAIPSSEIFVHLENFVYGDASKGNPQIPQLITMYSEFGARILSAPAYDLIFRCHDLLMFFDLSNMAGRGLDLLHRFSKRMKSNKMGTFNIVDSSD